MPGSGADSSSLNYNKSKEIHWDPLDRQNFPILILLG